MKKHAFDTIESDIRKEKAEALGRAGERLDRALLEIEAVRQEILCPAEECPCDLWGDHDRVRLELKKKVEQHARLCENARQLRHSLIIQREAVGLWRHEDVDRQYPAPIPVSIPILIRDGEMG